MLAYRRAYKVRMPLSTSALNELLRGSKTFLAKAFSHDERNYLIAEVFGKRDRWGKACSYA